MKKIAGYKMGPYHRIRGRQTLLFCGLFALAFCQTAQARIWTTRADMATARTYPGVTALDGKIYAIGGSQDPDPVGKTLVEVYDPTTDSWSQKADMPISRYDAVANVIDGKIYVVGSPSCCSDSNTLLVYDPATDAWSQKARMPASRRHMAAAAVDGKLYVFGGGRPGVSNQGSKSVYMYDPATDSWSQKADMLWDGIWLGDAAISFDGKIYLMGIASSFGQTPLRNVGMYDPVTDTWTPKADIPTRRIGLATALVGGKIYAISGGSRVYEGGKTVVEVYDPGADTWSTDEVAELSIPRAAAAATAVGGKIYVVGGLNPLGQPVATVEVYDFGQPIIRSAPDVYAASGARSTPLNFEVHLDLLSDAPAPGLVLDLSDYGQSAPVDLSHQGDGRYTGQASIEVPTLSGRYNLPLQLIPADSAPEPFFDLHLVVIPSQERLLSADGLTPEWTAPNSILVTFDPQATAQVFAGQTSLSLLPRLSNNTDYLVWGPAEPIEGAGYRLHFAFYPAELVDTEEPPTFNLSIWRQSPYGVLAATIVPLLSGDGEGPGVDLQRHAWQVVEIPLGAGSIQSIRFGGNLKGTTFYLDDIRLVPEELPAPITAVLEDHQDSTPAAFNLDQNYPNPFNSGTVIRFALPQAQEVDLTIFNLAGQQAVKLVKGIRPAGQYNLTWDGRDEAGQALASGLYFYRLQAGEQVKTRKLLMLR